MGYGVRDYAVGDEPSWLRCRAHQGSAVPAKPAVTGAELVAVDAGVVVGILDVAVAGESATIETFAVHPDHRHRGIGGALLSRARARAGALGATTLDAWAQDDSPLARWCRAMGFTEGEHVVAGTEAAPGDPVRPAVTRPGARPAKALARRGSARAHACRRFALPLASRGQLGRRGDDVDHRAVAQDGHRQR
ncbi:GNAT family N-acetyltransferase [Saccharothrix sp. HUAS TT1]|uniref:GNAT family N-acetyltransferase n=1 Tax=unclassified Saccharothrix TaxID=2593673 RepID=UPI00345BA109